MGPVTHSHDTVFKEDEDEDDEVVIVVPPHTDGGDHKEETRWSAGLKAQTVNIPQETEKQHNPETQEEEEKRPETFRDHRDEDTQTQPRTQHQKSQENKSQQEEETWKPEEDKQLNINTQEQEVNIIQQEVEEKEEQKDKINSEQKQEEELEMDGGKQEEELELDGGKQEEELELDGGKQEQELEMDGSKQEEELELDGSKQEEELEIGSTKEEAIYSCDINTDMGIKTKRNEHAEEVKEGQETNLRNYKQEVEQEEEEQEIKTNSSEQETENQEEKENKTNKCEQEIKIQEVEVEDGDKQANSVNEEEKLELCLMRTGDLPTDEQQQQQQQGDGKQITGVEPTLKKEEEKQSKVLQTPEDQENAEEQTLSVQEEEQVKADFCERRNKVDVEKAEKDQEPPMCDAPEKETEETITEEEIRCGDDLTVDQEASETVEQSGESETSQETKDEIVEGNNISKPEPKDPVPPQLDEKNEEAELEINITTESNPVRPPSGANQHPQLRLRRSSSSYASYPTILSEDTFRDPQQSIKRALCPQTTETEVPKQTQSSQTEVPQKPEQKSQKPKRRGLFQRLRAETPSKSTIPKIIIQDFSEGQEKLSSKERRRRRRMQERKEKEEEKERKKLEKELEKEKTKERKKPQTRGRSFQGLSRKQHDDDDDDDEVFLRRSNFSQTEGPKRTSYSDRYF